VLVYIFFRGGHICSATERVTSAQGHPRSLISVSLPIESFDW